MSIIPATLDLFITRGATWTGYKFQAQDAAGDDLELTGWTATAAAGGGGGEDPLVSFTASIDGDGLVVLDEMTPAETAALPLGEFAWSLWLENPSGQLTGPYIAGTLRTGDARGPNLLA